MNEIGKFCKVIKFSFFSPGNEIELWNGMSGIACTFRKLLTYSVEKKFLISENLF